RSHAAGAGEFRLPLDIAGIRAGDPGSRRVIERPGPIAPGLVGFGGVARARAENHTGGRSRLAAPAQAAPTGGRTGVMHGRFVIAGSAGTFAQTVNAAHIAGG